MADLKLFQYQHRPVRTVAIEGQIWFVAKDVCEILEIVNHRDAVSGFTEKMKRTVGVTDPQGQEQQTLVINEAGVYKLAFRSNKPEAERFTDWVTVEVMPEIRRTGRYEAKRQGILPLAAHTVTEVQKDMSKAVNSHNYQLGGKEAAMHYNVSNALAHTGLTPSQLIREAKKRGLKAKDRTSGKAVVRKNLPAVACCMSLADNLVEQGHEPEKVFSVTKTAQKVFEGILSLGAKPAELDE